MLNKYRTKFTARSSNNSSSIEKDSKSSLIYPKHMDCYNDIKKIHQNDPILMYRDIKQKRINDIEMSLNLSQFCQRRWSTGDVEKNNSTSLAIPERINRLSIRLSAGDLLKSQSNTQRNKLNVQQEIKVTYGMEENPKKKSRFGKLYVSPHTSMEIIKK